MDIEKFKSLIGLKKGETDAIVFLHALLDSKVTILFHISKNYPKFHLVQSYLTDARFGVLQSEDIDNINFDNDFMNPKTKNGGSDKKTNFEFLVLLNGDLGIEFIAEITLNGFKELNCRALFFKKVDASGEIPTNMDKIDFDAKYLLNPEESYILKSERKIADVVATLKSYYNARSEIQPIPQAFEASSFIKKLINDSDQGYSIPMILKHHRDIFSEPELKVLDWLGPTVNALLSGLISYDELLKLQDLIKGQNLELKSFLYFKWCESNLGLPAHHILRYGCPKASFFHEAITELIKKFPNIPVWEAIYLSLKDTTNLDMDNIITETKARLKSDKS